MGISHGASLVVPSPLQEGLVIHMGFDATANGYDSYTGYTGGISAWGERESHQAELLAAPAI